MRNYDIFQFGNVSIGIINTPAGEHEIAGGPILFAAWTARQLGCSIGMLTKTALKDRHRLTAFPITEEDLYWCESAETTLNEVVYRTASMETRVLRNVRRADSYRMEEFPDISAKVIQYCGPLAGDIDLDMIRFISGRGRVAMDAQSLMRKVLPNGTIENVDWDDKRDALPLIHYFKADAAEAAILTGIDTATHEGRVAAGRRFVEWGAGEVVISHHQGLIAASESGVVFSPFKNRNLSGRTGRGDTSFTAYIAERFTKKPADAVRFSAAMTSMKMEIPGPFKRTREDVEAFIREFYG